MLLIKTGIIVSIPLVLALQPLRMTCAGRMYVCMYVRSHTNLTFLPQSGSTDSAANLPGLNHKEALSFPFSFCIFLLLFLFYLTVIVSGRKSMRLSPRHTRRTDMRGQGDQNPRCGRIRCHDWVRDNSGTPLTRSRRFDCSRLCDSTTLRGCLRSFGCFSGPSIRTENSNNGNREGSRRDGRRWQRLTVVTCEPD